MHHSLYRRVAEFHLRLTFLGNLPHRSQIKAKCLYFNFDWMVSSKIGKVIFKKGEKTLSLSQREREVRISIRYFTV